MCGEVREAVVETLFTPDPDEKSLGQIILDSLLKAPVDLRKPLAERIFVIGGGANLPGLPFSSLSQELRAIYDQAIRMIKFI